MDEKELTPSEEEAQRRVFMRANALNKITARIFDCDFRHLSKEWEKDAILRRYDAGERE